LDIAAKPIRRDQLAALLPRFALEAPARAEARAVAGADPVVLMRAAHALNGRLRLRAAAAATAFVGCLDARERISRGRGASEGRPWA
jgi:hypothetical protein